MSWLIHTWTGNDTHALLTAGLRGLVGAVITGALGFLAVWQTTDETKVLITAGLVPFLTYLATRLGLEGVPDAMRQSAERRRNDTTARGL